jgi:cytochrome c-type protein NapC
LNLQATLIAQGEFVRATYGLLQPRALTYALIALAIALIIIFVARPSITVSPEGKILAFIAFFMLPVVVAGIGASEHMASSEETQFCLSCHIMAPWGRSLYVDDPNHIPAAHFQNHRIDPNVVCYTCHTDYAMFGTLRTKLEGLHHVYVNYFGTKMNPIRVYHPYLNRECLHCHLGARGFESNPVHMAIMPNLKNDSLSCVSSGCHDTVHNVATLANMKFWKPTD